MITTIDIGSFGIFKDFVWSREISEMQGDKDFKKVNIVYGRNYSGKTTLSRIVRTLETKELHPDYLQSQFVFTCNDGTQINQYALMNNTMNVCVYNTDFVKENLHWLHNDNGTIEPFTVLGAENIEIEQQINETLQRIGTYSEEEQSGLSKELHDVRVAYNEKNKTYQLRKNELESKLKSKANEEIKRNPLYGLVTYNIAKIKDDIAMIIEQQSSLLDDHVIEAYKKLIGETKKEPITPLPEKKPHFSDYFHTTKTLIEKRIKPSLPIAELLENSVLQAWVRQGRELHEHSKDRCSFCGNIIEESLWEKLDQHFSKESEELRDEIRKAVDILQQAVNALDSFISLNKEDFYTAFQEKYLEYISRWEILKKAYKAGMGELIQLLNQRHDDIFNTFEMIEIDDLSDEILSLLQNFNRLISENNENTNTLSTDQSKAKNSLRLNEIQIFMNSIDYQNRIHEVQNLERASSGFKEEVTRIENEIRRLNEEMRILQTQLHDESRGAELVNQYLQSHFGNDSFKLVASDEDEGVKYKILRGEHEAKNLSEGECSLISFCYFIAKIKDFMNDGLEANRPIIYIDDPISSLDSNHVFFIYSLIEKEITKPKTYKQLFISTHNLDFLKYIKRLTVAEAKDNLRHFFIERVQKQNDKKSLLKRMPIHLQKYTTEFNYLFGEIYKFYVAISGDRAQMINNTYNTFYNIPNNIRKFLEYYLFYKYPNTENPLSNIDKLFDENVPPLLQRVINEYSHLVFIDRGWSPMDVAEVEDCARIIIEKIQEKDSDQFEALVQSIQ